MPHLCSSQRADSGQHRRCQHQHSTIQLDYCFMHNPHSKVTSLTEKPKHITILTMVETIAGLCSAVITTKKRTNKTSDTTSHKHFVMEHGFCQLHHSDRRRECHHGARPTSCTTTWSLQRGRVHHMIIVAKEQWSGSIRPCSHN